mmetsp:Transcript_68230/g.146023  ORF Transcript_68230/g.146023 Transcript_68230/m.146023 type:complete len:205 (-) Transcript_68230:8-622(-)
MMRVRAMRHRSCSQRWRWPIRCPLHRVGQIRKIQMSMHRLLLRVRFGLLRPMMPRRILHSCRRRVRNRMPSSPRSLRGRRRREAGRRRPLMPRSPPVWPLGRTLPQASLTLPHLGPVLRLPPCEWLSRRTSGVRWPVASGRITRQCFATSQPVWSVRSSSRRVRERSWSRCWSASGRCAARSAARPLLRKMWTAPPIVGASIVT